MIYWSDNTLKGFPDSPVGKESTCNAGDSSSIPGSGRSPGEGIGHPLQYSWASLVTQMVKNLPVMQETWVRSLGQEVPLEEGMATHSSILAWRILCSEENGGPQSIGSQRVRHDWSDLACNHPNGRKQRGSKESFDEGERGEWKSWLKTQHSKN